MRVLIRAALVLLLLMAVGVGGIAVMMPRIVRSDAVRARIEGAAQDSLGREFRYTDLDFAWLPPSLLILDPTLAGDSAEDVPIVRAERVALRVELWPLLDRAVVVDSLVIEGARVRLVRDAEGVSLPGATAAKPESTPPRGIHQPESESDRDVSPPPARDVEGVASSEEAPPFDLAVRSVVLRGAAVVLEDRTLSPTEIIRLEDIDATLSSEALDQPIPFEVSASLESGGTIGAGGTATLDGDLDVTVELASIPLEAYQRYFGENLEAAGVLSGTVEARGPVSGAASVSAVLRLAEARLRLNEIEIDGPVAIRAGIEGGFAEPQVRFDIDATESALRLGTVFRKPPGKPATVSGRIVTGPDGIAAIEDVNLQIGTAKASARVLLEPETRIVGTIAPFDLTGWDEMVPALEEYHPAGQLRSDEITITTDPLDLRGTLHLDTVMAEIPNRGFVRATGSIEALGDEVHTRDLVVVASDQPISVEASLTNLRGTPRYRVVTESQDVDSNQLVSSLTERRDTFFGPLDFDGEFSGELGDGTPLASAHGLARFDVTNGRIVGLSLLHSLFNELGEVGASLGVASTLALGAAPLLTGKDLERYYGDEFELLAGTFQLADGIASTQDLRLVYRDYKVDFEGRFDLEASTFRLLAELTVGEAIDETLAGGDVDASKPPLVIPFPLQGRLDTGFGVGSNPTLAVDRAIVAGLVRRYGLDRHRDDAVKAIDDLLGSKGAGDDVVDILDGILGGAGKRKSEKD